MENNASSNKPDIKAINQSIARNLIHYDVQRIDYSVSSYELDQIKNASNNSFKDLFLLSIGIGISCSINALIAISKQSPFIFTLEIFINSLFGLIGLILAGIFGYFWHTTKRDLDKVVESIKSKPAYEMPQGGSLDSI